MPREMDIILFGATGFTGKNAIPIISKLSKAKNRQLKWGIAGRSEIKLKQVLAEYESKLGISLSDIPVITADAKDEKSLSKMARRARIIINCVSPYQFYGEPVIKACIEEGTHYVDVSGESEFIETMPLKYHKAAEEKGIYVITACGVGSIPYDLGVIFLKDNFNGTINSVETYLKCGDEDDNVAGPVYNFGSWETAVFVIANTGMLNLLRQKFYDTGLDSFKPKLQLRKWPHKNYFTKGWNIPALGPERSIIRRSQRFLYEVDKQRPVQVETYLSIKYLYKLLVLLPFWSTMLAILANFKFGRTLLLKYPEVFSGGLYSKNPSSEEKMNRARFSITLYGEGWKERLSNPDDVYTTPVDTAVCVEIKGRNPGYGATNKCLVLAAIMVLTESEKLPGNGGVLPPGYAFKNTSLIEELNENEVTFEVLFQKELKSNN